MSMRYPVDHQEEVQSASANSIGRPANSRPFGTRFAVKSVMSSLCSLLLFTLNLFFVVVSSWPVQAELQCQKTLLVGLHSQFIPFNPMRNGDFPPWSYTKQLLEEKIPEIHRQQLRTRLEEIEARKPFAPYMSLVRRFQKSQEIWHRWLKARDGFNFFSDQTSPQMLLRDYLEQDLLIYKWILEDTNLNLNSLMVVHKVVMKSQIGFKRSERIQAGELRQVDLFIPERNGLYPKKEEAERATKDYMAWFDKNKNDLHPLELAAQSYRWITSIQPFANGNKRLARWVANWILIKNGFPPLVYGSDSSLEDALVFGARCYECNPRPWIFINDFYNLVERSFNLKKEIFIDGQPKGE
jgi:hypothetical protein